MTPTGVDFPFLFLLGLQGQQKWNYVCVWGVVWQACLPVKDLDLGYNLVRTHDAKGAFVIVDHDELDPLASRAPMSTVYASGGVLPP